MRILQGTFLVVAIFMCSLGHAGKLSVEEGWVRAVPPVSKNTAAYFILHNHSAKDDMLLHLESEAAKHTELHTIVEAPNGVKQMKKVHHASIKAGVSLELVPGGYHVMLIAEMPSNAEYLATILTVSMGGVFEKFTTNMLYSADDVVAATKIMAGSGIEYTPPQG